MIGVNVSVEIDGETVSGHFDFEREPDDLDLEACRAVLRAVHNLDR